MREPGVDAEVNVLGSINVLEVALECGSRLIFASTGGALYGEVEEGEAAGEDRTGDGENQGLEHADSSLPHGGRTGGDEGR